MLMLVDRRPMLSAAWVRTREMFEAVSRSPHLSLWLAAVCTCWDCLPSWLIRSFGK